MLNAAQKDALRKWYTRESLLEQAREFVANREWELLEEHLQMIWLFPLSRHSELPEFMQDEAGQPLFPGNLNPRNDPEQWQDAIEIGWQVMTEEIGTGRDNVHQAIAEDQEADWTLFMKSVEERRRDRAKGG